MLNKSINKSKIYVAVWMVAYNHEPYISEAVESVISQETNFRFKLFLGVDFSTDDTMSICVKLKDKYPDKIKLFLQTDRIGAYKNGLNIYKNCYDSGAKYIALCEGDDYWSNPMKLQTQVNFLDCNKDYNACVHNSDILENDVIKKKEWRWDPNRTTFTCIDYIYSLFFHTSSLIFRANQMINFSPQPHILQGDMNLCLSVINDKKVFFIEESMSVYRKHSGGITNSNKHKNRVNKYKSIIYILNKFNSLTEHKFSFPVFAKKQTLKSLIYIYDETKAEKIVFFKRIKYYFFKTLLLVFVKTKVVLSK